MPTLSITKTPRKNFPEITRKNFRIEFLDKKPAKIDLGNQNKISNQNSSKIDLGTRYKNGIEPVLLRKVGWRVYEQSPTGLSCI